MYVIKDKSFLGMHFYVVFKLRTLTLFKIHLNGFYNLSKFVNHWSFL